MKGWPLQLEAGWMKRNVEMGNKMFGLMEAEYDPCFEENDTIPWREWDEIRC